VLAVGHHARDRHRQAAPDLVDQPGQVRPGAAQQAPRQQHLAAEAVAQDPQHLVADVRLEPVDRQHHPALMSGNPLQPEAVRQPHGQQLIVPVQQVGHRPLAHRQAAADQRPVDLGHAAVLPVPQRPGQRDHVQPELVLRQRDGPLDLGPARLRHRRTCSRSGRGPPSVLTVRRLVYADHMVCSHAGQRSVSVRRSSVGLVDRGRACRLRLAILASRLKVVFRP
jgi:hypothetical protein